MFDLWNFSSNNPIRAPFQIWLRIREVIRKKSRCLSGVNETAKALQLYKLGSKSLGHSGLNDTADAA
jgi:hypothetical protein